MKTDESIDSVHNAIYFTPADQTYFGKLYSSMRSRILREPVPATPTLTREQAQSIVQSLLTPQPDLNTIKDLSFSDFVPYLQSVKDLYIEYKRLQSPGAIEQAEDDLDSMVLQCFQRVPNYYFETSYHFNYTLFGEPRKVMNQYIDDAQRHLEEVEITLFFQINSRFDQFLTVVLNLNDMNGLIIANIDKMRQLIISRSKEIIGKKQSIESIETVLFNLKLVQSTQKSLIALQDLIAHQKYEQAHKLLRATEQTQLRLKDIQCLNALPQRLNALQSHLQNALLSHLLSLMLSQLTQQLTPTKSLLNNVHEHEDSVLANSFINDSLLEQSQQHNAPFREQEQLNKLIQSAVNIIDLSDKIFKYKILEELTGYYQEFMISLREFYSKDSADQILKFDEQHEQEQLTTLMDNVPPSDFIKIVTFFSDNLKRAIATQINSTKQLTLLVSTSDKLITVADEHYSIIVAMLKFTNEKLSQLLSLKRLGPDCSVREFMDILHIYKQWELFYTQDIARLANDCDERIVSKVKAQILKCSINQLIFMRAGQEKAYLQMYHKERQQQLRKYLENEVWVPADIPFENYEILSYLLDEETTSLELDESVLLNTSVRGPLQLSSSAVFKIVKTEIILLKENQKYKITQAFLFYLNVICNQLRLYESFATVTPEQTSKLLETIKLYSSLTIQLILGAGAIHFGKMKTISARNLAISSMCIRLFIYLIDPIAHRLLRIISQLNQDTQIQQQLSTEFNKVKQDFLNHNIEIITKLTTLLQERFQEQYDEIAKQQWNDQLARLTTPSKFTNTIIQNTRSLYVAVEEVLLIEDLKQVFSQIVNLLKMEFVLTFKNLNINTKIGSTRVKEELEYFWTSLNEIGQLKGLLNLEFEQLQQEIKGVIDKQNVA